MYNKLHEKLASLEKVAIGNTAKGREFIETALKNRLGKLHEISGNLPQAKYDNMSYFDAILAKKKDVNAAFAKERSAKTGVNINPSRYNGWGYNNSNGRVDIWRAVSPKDVYTSSYGSLTSNVSPSSLVDFACKDGSSFESYKNMSLRYGSNPLHRLRANKINGPDLNREFSVYSSSNPMVPIYSSSGRYNTFQFI